MKSIFLRGSILALMMATGLIANAYAQTAPKLSMPKAKVAMVLTELVQNAGLFAAIKGNYFAAEGLEVEIINFRSWTEPVQAIASDGAQFALGAGSLIRAVEGQNAPIRQIAMISSRFPYDFWVKKDSGIKSIADLKGKTIQTVRTGETLDNVWKQILAAESLSMTDVKRIESFNGFGSIISGQVDVANLNDSLMAKSAKANLVSLIDYTSWRDKHGMTKGAGANLGWGASLKVIQQNPDTVRAFARAMVKSADRLRKDKAFAISVLREKPFEIEEEVVETVWERHKDHWMMRMDLSKGDSAFDAEMVEEAMELKKGSIPLTKYSDGRAVTEAMRDLKIDF